MKTGLLLLAVVVVVTAAGLLVMRSGRKDSNAVRDPAISAPVKTSPMDASSTPVQNGMAVLTEYGTEWCPACKELAGVLDKIGPRYEGTLTISKVDLEKDSSDVTAISKLGFQGNIPFMVLKSSSGEVLWSGMGYVPEGKLVQILSEKGITGKN